ncbi:MAG: cytidine deaminase [Bacteroidetes bacterium]|nr:MAG: cytidine deaminase [Bacteroidota bacterium]
MQKVDHHFSFEVYDSVDELPESDKTLIHKARTTTAQAYAPYSNFLVGAVGRLSNGELVYGTNQENASFPAGICAERVLLSAASSLFPGVAIDTIAISYDNRNGESVRPVSPCGICRQSLLEYENRFHHPIRLILSGMKGKAYVVQNAADLLPLSFTSDDLK